MGFFEESLQDLFIESFTAQITKNYSSARALKLIYNSRFKPRSVDGA